MQLNSLFSFLGKSFQSQDEQGAKGTAEERPHGFASMLAATVSLLSHRNVSTDSPVTGDAGSPLTDGEGEEAVLKFQTATDAATAHPGGRFSSDRAVGASETPAPQGAEPASLPSSASTLLGEDVQIARTGLSVERDEPASSLHHAEDAASADEAAPSSFARLGSLETRPDQISTLSPEESQNQPSSLSSPADGTTALGAPNPEGPDSVAGMNAPAAVHKTELSEVPGGDTGRSDRADRVETANRTGTDLSRAGKNDSAVFRTDAPAAASNGTAAASMPRGASLPDNVTAADLQAPSTQRHSGIQSPTDVSSSAMKAASSTEGSTPASSETIVSASGEASSSPNASPRSSDARGTHRPADLLSGREFRIWQEPGQSAETTASTSGPKTSASTSGRETSASTSGREASASAPAHEASPSAAARQSASAATREVVGMRTTDGSISDNAHDPAAAVDHNADAEVEYANKKSAPRAASEGAANRTSEARLTSDGGDPKAPSLQKGSLAAEKTAASASKNGTARTDAAANGSSSNFVKASVDPVAADARGDSGSQQVRPSAGDNIDAAGEPNRQASALAAQNQPRSSAEGRDQASRRDDASQAASTPVSGQAAADGSGQQAMTSDNHTGGNAQGGLQDFIAGDSPPSGFKLESDAVSSEIEVPVDLVDVDFSDDKPAFSPERASAANATLATDHTQGAMRGRSASNAAWLRSILSQSINSMTLEKGGWKVIEMQLDEGQGTMTVRARRDDEKVSVSVSFSDPQLRSLAEANASRLQEMLRSEYETNVDFSLLSDGAGGSSDRGAEGQREAAPANRLKVTDGDAASTEDRRRTARTALSGNRNEWIG